MSTTESTAKGVVISLEDCDDLAFLRALETDEPSDVAVICLHRDGVAVPTWFESTARALAERRPVAVLRHPSGVVGFTDCRGEWQDVFGTDLSAALRGLVEGAGELCSPGYRELFVGEVDRPL